MAAFNWTNQQKAQLPPNSVTEFGVATAQDVSSQTFNIPTKMKKIMGGLGIMVTDGLPARVTTPGTITSTGLVGWTRIGSISTSADTMQYIMVGRY